MLRLKDYDLKSLFQESVCKEYAVSLRPLEEGEKISILSDSMFKTMFQNENRLKYSCKFLSYFLDATYEELLNNIHLAKHELDKKQEKDKNERCDYVAYLKGTYINIEVNNNSSLETMERNIEYLMRLYARKVKRGEKYEYTPSISFNLNNFSIKGNDKIIDIYAIQNKEGILLTDKIIIVQIFVPNLRRKWYNEGIRKLTELERYILTLVERKVEDVKELGIGDEIMNDYVKESIEVSDDLNFGEAYDKEWALKDEGKREGRDEGAKEKQVEIAQAMILKKLDIKTISECTGLTIEEINNLKED